MNAQSTVIVHLAVVTRPQSGAQDFKRWKAAIPNEAASAFGQPFPSFRKPYFVDESSDMVGLDEQITARFLDSLTARGFTNIQFI